VAPSFKLAISLTAENGHEAVVKLLLEKGAELDSEDRRGQTPLSLVAEKGHEAVVKLLLEKGAELDSKDVAARTPLLWAAVNGHEVSGQRRKSFKSTK
jgi:ankyrin repeat protein